MRGREAGESHWGSHFLPNRKNVTESPSFSAGDNPPVLFSSDFRISGAPEKVRDRTLWLQASWNLNVRDTGVLGEAWEAKGQRGGHAL